MGRLRSSKGFKHICTSSIYVLGFPDGTTQDADMLPGSNHEISHLHQWGCVPSLLEVPGAVPQAQKAQGSKKADFWSFTLLWGGCLCARSRERERRCVYKKVYTILTFFRRSQRDSCIVLSMPPVHEKASSCFFLFVCSLAVFARAPTAFKRSASLPLRRPEPGNHASY